MSVISIWLAVESMMKEWLTSLKLWQPIVIKLDLGSIQELDLSGNEMGTNNALALLKTVASSKITSIVLKQLRFTSEVLLKIEEIIKEKSDLQLVI